MKLLNMYAELVQVPDKKPQAVIVMSAHRMHRSSGEWRKRIGVAPGVKGKEEPEVWVRLNDSRLAIHSTTFVEVQLAARL